MSNDLEDIMGDVASDFIGGAAARLGRKLVDRTFQAQENEEFVEINPDGTIKPVNPTETPKGAVLRDPIGEY